MNRLRKAAVTTARQTDLERYYANRAAEYDRIYDRPERQADLKVLEATVRKFFAGKRVLEIACGTGYWTRHIGATARSIVALDINPEPMALAMQRDYGCAVRFVEADALRLSGAGYDVDAVFAGFFWSHLPRAGIGAFLCRLNASVGAGRAVMVVDNRYVDGSSTPVARTDGDGNTYQLRRLDDGSEYEVLKNFTGRDGFLASLDGATTGAEYRCLDYYWTGTFNTLLRNTA